MHEKEQTDCVHTIPVSGTVQKYRDTAVLGRAYVLSFQRMIYILLLEGYNLCLLKRPRQQVAWYLLPANFWQWSETTSDDTGNGQWWGQLQRRLWWYRTTVSQTTLPLSYLWTNVGIIKFSLFELIWLQVCIFEDKIVLTGTSTKN